MARDELVRQAINELNVCQNKRTLGSANRSFGIATWNNGMVKDGSALVQAADVAFYEAKRV